MFSIARVLGAVLAALACGCDPVSVTGAWCQYPADCHRPNECSNHRCRPPCETSAECATHLCLAGHCAVEQDEGCVTFPERMCAGSLVCAEDRCTLRCTTSCANDAVCRPASDQPFSICVSPDEASPSDAGAGGPG